MKLSPIFQTSYKWWRNKKSSQSIKISKKSKKAMEKLVELCSNNIEKAEKCMGHKLDYAFLKPYRLYKRGKNRCKNCGVKL